MVRNSQSFPIRFPEVFKQKAFAWAQGFEVVCYLDHNGYEVGEAAAFDALLAVGESSRLLKEPGEGAFDALKGYVDEAGDWLFGFLAYDLKNEVEDLSSGHPDGVGFPALHFFRPRVVVEIKGEEMVVHALGAAQAVFDAIAGTVPLVPVPHPAPLHMRPVMSRDEYLQKVEAVRQHIGRGDIYEMNLCQEFFAEGSRIDAPGTFQRLNQLAQAPFAAYYKLYDRYLLCSSPERFLKKNGSKLTTQPIKGTLRRGRDEAEDELLRQALSNSPKDRAENVMIVDLVRNDLARSCVAGSVVVEELCGVYAFRQVLQLVSTVSGQLSPGVHAVDAIRRAFPMGSMTGAPKVRSMELIERYEKSRRGLYSGAVGYFSPSGDFDFNVVIRSIFYNETDSYLSFQVGGAIVFDSVPEAEYEECMLKAKGMFAALS